MKFERITPGMVLYDAHKHRMGNATMWTMGVWPVKILSVDAERRTAIASWNGNRAEVYYERDLRRLREKEPKLVKVGWGHRLARRGEVST